FDKVPREPPRCLFSVVPCLALLFLPLCFVYLFQLVPAISSPLNTSSLHIQHSNSHLCPLK
uniref:Uncharacterized protein n=1 Tax=Accipiter nisus TaxID=211598 RepID=A0A8B9LZC2_9AVES